MTGVKNITPGGGPFARVQTVPANAPCFYRPTRLAAEHREGELFTSLSVTDVPVLAPRVALFRPSAP